MLSSSILLPPSPNWYGSQLLSLQPSTGQAAYAGHNSVVVACLHTHKIQRTMCAGPSRVTSLCWAPVSVAAQQLVAGHEDGSLRTWDARTGACLRSHKKKGPEISALVLLDRQPAALAVAGDLKGGLQTWAFQTSAKPKTLNITLRAQVTHLVALSRPQPSSGNTTTLSSSSVAGVQQEETPAAPQQQVGAELVAAACADGSISILDIDAGVVLQCFSAHRGCVQTLSGGGWDVSPPGLQALGCSVLVTASSEEGTVKVWQVAMGSRSPSVTRLATLTAPVSRDAAAGRNTRQRSNANQWLSACALPMLQHPLLSVGSSSPGSGATADQELAQCCWVAMGLPSGEIWLHCIHTGHGRVDPPYKLHNVHNRPIYGIVAMLDMAASSASGLLPSRPQPATGEDTAPAAGSEDPAEKPTTQSSRLTNDGAVTGSDAETMSADTAGQPGTTQVGGTLGKAGFGSIVLASISQDRILGVSCVNFKLGVPPAVTKAAAKKQPTKLSQDNIPTPVPSISSSTSPSPLPPPPPPPPPEPAQDLPTVPTTDGDSGKGGFRIALGPPADRNQRGFTGRGRGRGAGGASGPTAPGSLEPNLQLGNQQDAEITNTTAAAAAQQQVPMVVTEPNVLQGGEYEHSESAAGPSRQVVSGHQVLWKASGLGGYGHSVDVSVPTEHGVEAGLQKGRLNLAVGSGDRTIRTVTLQWPVAVELLPGRAAIVQGDRSTDATDTEEVETHTEGTEITGAGAATSLKGALLDQEPLAPGVLAMSADLQGGQADSHGQVVARCTAGQPNLLSTAMLWYGLTDQVICVARHPLSTRYIAFGCQDGQVGVYDFKAQAPYLYPTRHQGPVLQLCWYAAAYPQPIAPQQQQQSPELKQDQQAAATPASGNSTAYDAADIAQAQGSASTVFASQPVPGPTVSTGPTATTDGNPAAAGKGKPGRKSGSGAATDHAAAVHAACQSWCLMSCGAEGRLLTWQLPGHDEMAAAIQQGGMPAGGPAGGGASRGGADRAGRWGGGSQQPAAGPPNDLLARLLPLIPAVGATGMHGSTTSQATSSAAAMAVVPDPAHTGDLLVIATAAGTLAVFQQQPPGPAQAGGPVLRPGMPGYNKAAQARWTLVWYGMVEGAAPQHMSCVVSPQLPNTLFIACATSIGSVSCYHVQLGTASVSQSASTKASPSNQLASIQPPVNQLTSIQSPVNQPASSAASSLDGILLGDASRSITALCWLADASAVAVAYTDQTIQVWYVGHVLHSGDQLQLNSSVLQDLSHTGPLLLCTLKGHTDAVMSLVSRTVHPHAAPQPTSASAAADSTGQGATNGSSQVATCAWLFSASRDQSVRGWVLHLNLLVREAVHTLTLQQQREAAALQEARQAAVIQAATPGADAVVDSGHVAHEAGSVQADVATGVAVAATGLPAGAPDKGKASANEETAGSTTAAATNDAAAATGVDAVDESESVAESENITEEKTLPSWLTAAPAKSDITGIPGARLPGAKKVPVLGHKPLLQAPSTGQAAVDAQAALQQLNRLLGQASPRLAAAPGQEEPAAATDPVLGAVLALGDPVALAATGQLPRAPEKLIMSHLWMGDVRRALQVAIEFSMLTADLVSASASQGRAVWSATSRLYAAQQEQAGQVHVAVMHLLAIGDRPAAAAVYRRAGLVTEAKAVEGTAVLIQSACTSTQ